MGGKVTIVGIIVAGVDRVIISSVVVCVVLVTNILMNTIVLMLLLGLMGWVDVMAVSGITVLWLLLLGLTMLIMVVGLVALVVVVVMTLSLVMVVMGVAAVVIVIMMFGVTSTTPWVIIDVAVPALLGLATLFTMVISGGVQTWWVLMLELWRVMAIVITSIIMWDLWLEIWVQVQCRGWVNLVEGIRWGRIHHHRHPIIIIGVVVVGNVSCAGVCGGSNDWDWDRTDGTRCRHCGNSRGLWEL